MPPSIDAIATDHAPHHRDEKCVEFSCAPFGVVGLETAVSLCVDRLIHGGVLGLSRLDPAVATNLHRRTGGNVLFALETLLALRDQGLFDVGDDPARALEGLLNEVENGDGTATE